MHIDKLKNNIYKDQWIDFYEILKEMYVKDNEFVDKVLVIKTLKNILKVTNLLNIYLRIDYEFIIQICSKQAHSMLQNQQQYFLLFIKRYFDHIAEDCRTLCCYLGEKILPFLLKFHEEKYGDGNKRKSTLFDLLLLQVQLHHPKRSFKQSQLAYADNWNLWIELLSSIFDTCKSEMEIFYSHTVLNQSWKTTIFSDNFIELVCSVFIQLQNLHVSHLFKENINKRVCHETNFSILKKKLEKINWTWLFLVKQLLITSKNVFTKSELEIISNILIGLHCDQNNKGYYDLKYLIETLAVLVTNGEITEQCILEKLWQNSLTNLEMNTTLLKSLLNSKRIPENLVEEALKKLYANDNIDFNDSNLELLLCFRNCLNIDNVKENLQKDLLNWILKPKKIFSDNNTSIMSYLIASLIFQNYQINYLKTDQENTDFQNIFEILALENMNVSNSTLLKNKKFDKIKYLIRNDIYNYLVDILYERSIANFRFNSSVLIMNELCFLIKLLNIISLVIFDYENITELVKKNLRKLSAIADTDFEKDLFVDSYNLFECFLKLGLEGSNKAVLSAMDNSICNKLLIAFKSDDIFTESESQNLSSEEEISFMNNSTLIKPLKNHKSMKVILIRSLSYCCTLNVNINVNKFDIFDQIIRFFNENISEPKNFIYFQNFVEIIIENNETESEIIQEVFNLMLMYLKSFTNDYIMISMMKSIRNIIPLLYDSNVIENTQKHLINLFSYCNSIKDNYGPIFSQYLIEGISEFFKFNQNFDLEECEILIEIIFSKTNYVTVHITISNVIQTFFTLEYTDNINKIRQKMFKKLLTVATKNIKDLNSLPTSEYINKDIYFNTVHCEILKFAKVILSNRTYIKELFLELMTLLNSSLNVKLIIKTAIQKLFRIIKNTINIRRYVQFLFANETDTFPFYLFDYSDEISFYKDYLKEIILVLLNKYSKEQLENIFQRMDSNLKTILSENFACITPSLIYFIQKAKDKEITQVELTTCKQCLTTIYTVFDNVQILKLIKMNFSEIFLNSMKSFSDDQDFQKTFSINPCPISGNYFIDAKTMLIIFQFFEKKIIANEKLSTYLLQSSKYLLQDILHKIKIEIYDERFIEIKIRYYHFYVFFVEFLKTNSHNKNNLSYIEWETINMSLNVLKQVPKSQLILSKIICKYLTDVFMNAVLNLKLFKESIQILTSLVKFECPIRNNIIRLIEILLQKFRDNIYDIPPFPDNDLFQGLNEIYNQYKYDNHQYNLSEEIQFFLKSDSSSITNLQVLSRQLFERKVELNALIENRSELIQQLINQLLMNCTKSMNKKMMIEIIKVFGEIGPSDLSHEMTDPNCKFYNLIESLEKSSDKTAMLLENLICCSIKTCIRYLCGINTELMQHSRIALEHIVTHQLFFNIPDNLFDANTTKYLSFLKKDIKETYDCNRILFQNCNLLLINELWFPKVNDHNKWIHNLTKQILEVGSLGFFKCLIAISEFNIKYSEEIFQYLIIILISTSSEFGEKIMKQIKQFFNLHFNKNRENDNFSIINNKSSVQCLLTSIHLIRNICCKYEKDLNYLKIAKAAYFTKFYFSVIFYLELWSEKIFCKYKYNYFEKSKVEFLYEKKEYAKVNAFIEILKKSYEEIGNEENVIGCDAVDISNVHSILEHDTRLKCWDRVLLHYDINLLQDNDDNCNNSLGLSEALKNLGLYNLALKHSNQLNDFDYECAWRLSKWSITSKYEINEPLSFNKCEYFCLKAMINNDTFILNDIIDKTRGFVVGNLTAFNFNNSKKINNILLQCSMINEIENFYEALETNNLEKIFQNWSLSFEKIQFQYNEPILSQRITMLRNRNEKQCIDQLISLSMKLLSLARITKNYPVAIRIINDIENIPNLSNEIKHSIMFEKAQIRWNHDKNSAKLLLNNLLKSENELNLKLKVASLTLFGEWMFATSSENPQIIIDKYFKNSLKLLISENIMDYVQEIAQINDTLAKYADIKYRNISNYIKSTNFSTKKRIFSRLEKQKDELNYKIAPITQNKLLLKSVHQVEVTSRMDEEHFEQIYDEEEFYQNLALIHYAKNLVLSDTYNFRIFRFFSLWLMNKILNTPVLDIITQIPSYKFIPLLPQLISQLNNPTDCLSSKISEILQKCAKDHPHHTLPILLTTSLLQEDSQYTNDEPIITEETHMIEAKKILDNLQCDPYFKKLLFQMEELYRGLIQVAYLTSCSTSDIVSKLSSLKNYDLVHVPTVFLSVQKSCQYKNIISILKYSTNYTNLRGINKPKKLTCYCSNGVTVNQLLKGQDDLRQDAVMQQIFSVLNNLLSKDENTTGLRVRSYKVVPLSQRCGIIEWCEDTITLASYFLEVHGLEIIIKNREKLQNVVNENNQIKLSVFKEICSEIQPKFHEKFIREYKNHKLWYDKRQSYVKSVATSSMIGYIIGLGDRHLSNILFDNITAELIHIDFGLAFEFAKTLHIPEQVPFRLTREIIAPMGVLGIQGSFKLSCEKTLNLLTKNSDIILSFLEVFLYDPLYSWKIISNKVENIKVAENTTKKNNLAERALLRIHEKLTLIENGALLSVESQVEKLIQEATDPANLCCIFSGWLPFL